VRAYYYLNVGFLCGICGWAMSEDVDFNVEQMKGDAPFKRKAFCGNENCAQHNVPLIIGPLEVEVPA